MIRRPNPVLVRLGDARRETRADQEVGMFELNPVTRYMAAGAER